VSDFDDELERFEQYEPDPLDFFEEDDPRGAGAAPDHGVRILGADEPSDLDFDLDDSLASFGREPEERPAVEEAVDAVDAVEAVEAVEQPYADEDDVETEDSWPPKSGLAHRFPRAEEDEFWGETSRGSQGWSEPEHPAEPERAVEPEWTETSGQVRAVGPDDWSGSGPQLVEPDIEPDWASSPSSTTRFDRLEFEDEEPVQATGEGSGPIPLPHWTDPPTGEIPRVVVSDDEPEVDEDDDDHDAWASVSGQMPRFRVGDSDWAEADFADVEQLKDDSMAVGALSEAEVVVDDDAEFEEEVAARRRGFRGNRPPKAPRAATAAPPDERPAREHRPARPLRRPQLERGDDMPAPRASDNGTGGPGPDLQTRVLTGVAIAVVALIMFKLGRGPAAFLVAVIVGLAAFELYEAFRRQGYHPATILGVIGAMSMVGIAYKADNYGLQAFPLVTALIVIFTMLWYMAEVVKARPVINIAITLFVFSYVGVLGAFGGLLLSSPNGTGLVLGTAICAVGYDVFGYFVGSQFGRSRLAPRLSPNKTWEGLFGGMLASLILGAIVSAFLTPWDGSITDGLALGLVVAIVAPLGDLCESMIKRDLGVKDLGTILPGHGGVLDRFDAILFCLPAVFYLAIQLGIG
jgi:phosphatidate cytidylyltransferase